MESINEQTQVELKSGTRLDIGFVFGNKAINTNGHVKDSSDETIVIEFEVDDKEMIPPVGTDIYILKNSICYNITESKNFPEVKATKVHRRKHIRVDNILKINYKKISQKHYIKHKDKPLIIYKNIFGEPFKTPEIEEVNLKLLYELIYQTNLKMDRILDMLEGKRTEKYAVSENENVNISGAGIRFAADQAFSIGDIIALRIFLATQTQINVLGEVRKVIESEKKGKYFIAVKFVELSENDREMIIKYVFKRQREILRLTSDHTEKI
ncbi:MAG: PilZ domain-containing protein [Deltaproteobacteria bacterium]|nr:PilZ domain-containing protein [Deltaproteobacteria bacterium]